jgi:hypothetical protein
VDGKQHETYIGTAAEEGEKKAGLLNAQIEEVKALLPDLRLLAREGFQFADPKTYATLASLHQHGIFAAGATLVGSHAFGALINQLGIRSVAYATEDVDVARREALAFDRMPEVSFLDMLRDSGIHFVEVPQLDYKKPPSSFKQQGMSRFHVDLLVPSSNSEIKIVAVPELKAHATALPYLAYVLGQTQITTLLAREGCCPVRIPLAERFAVHKLVVSQLRTNRDAKSEKDIFQASVILAALGEKHPGAIELAAMELPVSARKYFIKASAQALKLMQGHPRAAEELSEVLALLAQPKLSLLAEQWHANPATNAHSGTIKAISNTEVIQHIGQGRHVVWDKTKLTGAVLELDKQYEIGRDGEAISSHKKSKGMQR